MTLTSILVNEYLIQLQYYKDKLDDIHSRGEKFYLIVN